MTRQLALLPPPPTHLPPFAPHFLHPSSSLFALGLNISPPPPFHLLHPPQRPPSIQRLQLGEHNAAAVFKLLTTPSHKLISTQRLTSFYQRRFGRRQANPAANLSKQRPRHFNLDALVVDAMLEFKPPAGKTHVSKPKAAYVCHAFDIIGISPASA
uniref:Uncharacterized protein n=1 Tax=Favolaschia claudopus TaxID=2862362 RepID=A0AAV9YY20_9AGAR